ncbi:phenylacetate-CoA oxygenase subunit PaaC [Chryseobacterium taklimakanense]|uniref:1,2-phenylacetyl-CoA epoxidase subunit PaaC n=1 Tax=Chryseobacterium taklimakanense TaxID=536441 RepID=UPI001EF5F9D0|nr:1,2-phenylacetyl-CoA epoxidase subunit PaaC [Chryseobacterium taklimakanense]MCG7280461.1 phenylacetate-CoA oxygenase subunit PaaC [Chryseobacterium taklimakanense]
MKNYLLKLADDTLIMGQRLAEWCGKGPYLEEDIALTNIALDYLGQSSNFYKYAAQLQGDGKSEDDLAFLRYEHEYLNAQLVEFPNGDYAQTILKVYFFAAYQKLLYESFSASSDEQMSALAQKSLKEVKYHYTHASTWVKMFAQGTEESSTRLQNAISNLWEYTGGLFDEVDGETELVKLDLIPDSKRLYADWKNLVAEDFEKFGIDIPESEFMQKGSRKGFHTEYFGYILCELQYMQRAYPGCEW